MVCEEAQQMAVNKNKKEFIEVDGVKYARYAVKTCVVKKGDDVCEVIKKYAGPHLQKGDTVFISEKMVACTQGRAIPLDEIKPRKLAKFLSSHVYKNPGGIGLAMPETMEMALRECGVFRILVASACGVIGKLLGKRGWFYIVAGRKAASIDGPCSYTIPPYNHYVVLGPANPDDEAKKISKAIGGTRVLIVDVNDLGGEILGSSEKVDKPFWCKVLKDNPLGQSDQCTPCGIIRKAE